MLPDPSLEWSLSLYCLWRMSSLSEFKLLSSVSLSNRRSDNTGELLSYGDTSPLDALRESLDMQLSFRENESSGLSMPESL